QVVDAVRRHLVDDLRQQPPAAVVVYCHQVAVLVEQPDEAVELPPADRGNQGRPALHLETVEVDVTTVRVDLREAICRQAVKGKRNVAGIGNGVVRLGTAIVQVGGPGKAQAFAGQVDRVGRVE